jgi:hypothetical protein
MVEYSYSIGVTNTKLQLLQNNTVSNITFGEPWYNNMFYREISGPRFLRVISITKSAIEYFESGSTGPALTIGLRIAGAIAGSLDLSNLNDRLTILVQYSPESIMLPTLNYINLPSAEGDQYIKSLTFYLLTNVGHAALLLVSKLYEVELKEYKEAEKSSLAWATKLYEAELKQHEAENLALINDSNNGVCDNPYYNTTGIDMNYETNPLLVGNAPF